MVDLVLAYQDLAPTGAVNLDGGIPRILGGRLFISENDGSTTSIENRIGALMVRGVVAKGFRWASRCDESLHDPIRSPRFFTSRLKHDRRFERDRWHPD